MELNIDKRHKVWFQRFRPSNIEGVIMPDRVKNSFRGYVEKRECAHILLSSPMGGTGKTTALKALAYTIADINDVSFIEGASDTSVNVIRGLADGFARGASLDGSPRIIIVDEVDRMSEAARESLKSVIESISMNCYVFMTCNNVSILPPQILSRCHCYDFEFDDVDRQEVTPQVVDFCKSILHHENIDDYEIEAIDALVAKFWPDNRRIVNEVHKFAMGGNLTYSAVTYGDIDQNAMFAMIANGSYHEMREFIHKHLRRFDGQFHEELYKGIIKSNMNPMVEQKMLYLIHKNMVEYRAGGSVLVHILMLFTEMNQFINSLRNK